MFRQINQIYEFGEFRLETSERLLLQRGKPISLTPKAFEILLALVQSSGRYGTGLVARQLAHCLFR